MAKTDQFLMEVRFVPLPPNELQERRARLCTLLLRGAMRLVVQQGSQNLTEKESVLLEAAKK